MLDAGGSIAFGFARASVLLLIAAVAAQWILVGARVHSARWHRLTWLVVLLQGWIVVSWTVEIPWYETTTSSTTSPTLVSHPAPRGITNEDGQWSNEATPVSANVLTQSTSLIPWNRRTIGITLFWATWLIGVVGCVVVHGVRYVWFIRELHQKSFAASAEQAAELEALQREVLGAIRVPMLMTDNDGPFLCLRFGRPCLVVPEWFWRDFNATQRQAMLRHELAHYIRGDLWASLAARVLALPHWFNPAAWWALRQFEEAAEWSCDQAACPQAADAIELAKGLLALVEPSSSNSSFVSAVRGRGIVVRVSRLFQTSVKEDAVMKKSLLLITLIGVLMAGAVNLRLTAKAEETTEPVKTKFQVAPAKEPSEVVAADSLVSFTGVVKDVESGQPISGAKVIVFVVERKEATASMPSLYRSEAIAILKSDHVGHFSLKRSLPVAIVNAFAIVESPENGAYLTRHLELDHKKFLDLNQIVELQKGILVKGRVTNSSTGEPVQGAVNAIPAITNSTKDRFRTRQSTGFLAKQLQQDGSFEITVTPGRNVLVFEAPKPLEYQRVAGTNTSIEKLTDSLGINIRDFDWPDQNFPYGLVRANAISETRLEWGETASPQIGLVPIKPVTVTLRDQENQPIAGANAYVLLDSTVTPMISDNRGCINVNGLDGTNQGVIFAKHSQRDLGAFAIVNRGLTQQDSMTLFMEPLAKIRGRIVKETGESIAGIKVTLANPINDGWPIYRSLLFSNFATSQTNAEGSFEFLVPAGANFDLHINHSLEKSPRLHAIPGDLVSGKELNLGTITMREYTPPKFQGQAAIVQVQSELAKPATITLWFPKRDEGSFRSWILKPGETKILSDAHFGMLVCGDDWGIQLNDHPIQPLATIAKLVPAADGKPFVFEVKLTSHDEVAAR